MIAIDIPFNLLSLFSADRQVYRAFDHLVAARCGTLLLVPPCLVVGNMDAVVEGCPVPWEEVHAVLAYPQTNFILHKGRSIGISTFVDMLDQLEAIGIDPATCDIDCISPMVRGEEKVLRLVHPSGVRYAVVMA